MCTANWKCILSPLDRRVVSLGVRVLWFGKMSNWWRLFSSWASSHKAATVGWALAYLLPLKRKEGLFKSKSDRVFRLYHFRLQMGTWCIWKWVVEGTHTSLYPDIWHAREMVVSPQLKFYKERGMSCPFTVHLNLVLGVRMWKGLGGWRSLRF